MLALEVAQGAGFSEEEGLHKIGMAVREAMVNAVVHGNRYNLKRKYSLACLRPGTFDGDDYRRRRRF